MADLLTELRRGGELDSSGTFTLDRRKAQQKMREFQLVDPHHYILCLVQSGVALGARAIQVQADLSRVSVVLEGVELPAEFLEQPLSALFISQSRFELDGYRELAVGLNAILALSPKKLTLQSGATRLTMETGEPLTTTVPPQSDTRIEVEERLSWRLDTLKAVFNPQDVPEVRALTERAFCPVPLHVNGTRLERPAPLRRACYQGNGFELWLGGEAGHVAFVKHGIRVATRELPLRPPTPTGAVVADRLVMNASSTDVVEDEHYQAVLADLERACDAQVDVLCAEYAQGDADVRRELRPAVLAALHARKATLSGRMLAVPAFRLAQGEWVSLASLNQRATEKTPLLYLDAPPPSTVPEELLLVDAAGESLAILKAFLGNKRVKLAGDEVARALRRQENMRRWERQAQGVHVPADDYLLVVPFHDEGFSGELAVVSGGSMKARISFYQKGRSLAEEDVETGLSYRAAINHDGFVPTFTWDGIVHDERYRQALACLETAFAEACRRLAESLRPPHPDASVVRKVLVTWLTRVVAVQHRTLDAIPPVVRDYPLLPTASSRLASLDDLARDHDEFKRVFYAQDVAAGPQRDHRQIVLASQATLKLLQGLWGPREVVDYTRTLEQERQGMARAQGPSEVPGLSGQALFPTTFQHERVRGQVGLSLSVTSGSKGDKKEARIRFLVDGKALVTRTVALPFGPLEAVVDAPDLTPTAAWDDVEQDDAFLHAMRALMAGCAALADKVAAEHHGLDGWKLTVCQQFLIDYIGSREATVSDTIRSVPLFKRLEGGVASLGDVGPDALVRFVAPPVPRIPSHLPGMVLLCRSAEHRALVRALGEARVQDWKDDLARALAEEDYEARPRQAMALPDAEDAYLIVVPVPAPARGLVGILAPDARNGKKSDLVVLCRERVAETVPMATPVAAAMIATAPDLQLAPGMKSVKRDAAFASLCEAVSNSFSPAIERLAARTIAPHTPAAQVLLQWALSQASTPRDLREATDLLGRVADLPLLDDTSGRPCTLRECGIQFKSRSRLYWAGPDVCGTPMDADLRVIRMGSLERVWMGACFTSLQNHASALAQDEQVRLNRSKARVASMTIEGCEVLARRTVTAPKWEGELGISADGRCGIELVVDGIVVETRALWGPLPVVGRLASSWLRPSKVWDSASFPRDQLRFLEEDVDAVYADLGRNDQHRALVLVWLHHCGSRWKDGTVADLPLFETTGGRRSLRDVDAAETVFYSVGMPSVRPPGLCLVLPAPRCAELDVLQGVLGVRLAWLPPPRVLAARALRQRLVDTARAVQHAAVVAADGTVQLLADATTESAPTPPGLLETALQHSWHTLSAGAVDLRRRLGASIRLPQVRAHGSQCQPLAGGLQRALRALPRRKSYGLRDPVIDGIQVQDAFTLALGAPPLQYEHDGERTFVNARHPLVRRLAKAYGGGGTVEARRAIVLLATAMFVAIRQAEPGLTDDRELAFLQDIAEWLAASDTSRRT